MSDTPRTDANLVRLGEAQIDIVGTGGVVPAGFARELEREVSEKRQTIFDQDKEITNLRTSNQELHAEVDRLKEWNQQRAGEFACTEQRLATGIAYLREALSASRPFVAYIAEHPNSFGENARKIGSIIDYALIQTVPDPRVQAILNDKA